MFAISFSPTTAQTQFTPSNQDQLTTFEEGDVVQVVPDSSGNPLIIKTKQPLDPRIAGVVVFSADFTKEVLYAGKAIVKVTASNGPIQPGDFVTSSSLEGVAMKATNSGFMLGRALHSFAPQSSEEIGYIEVAVQLGWFDPALSSEKQEVDGENASSTEKVWSTPLIDINSLGVRSLDSLQIQRLDVGEGKVTIDPSGNISTVGSLIIASNITTIGDACVAATCVSLHMELYTNNKKDFRKVNELVLY